MTSKATYFLFVKQNFEFTIYFTSAQRKEFTMTVNFVRVMFSQGNNNHNNNKMLAHFY